MNTSIKAIVMLILVTTLHGCNQGSTLQSYYVDKELAPGFTSLDVPISMLKIDKEKLSSEQKEAYESLEKLSLLAFVKDDANDADMNEEFDKVKTILKDPKYQELMRGGNSTDGRFEVKFVGEEDSVDEFILMGSSNDKGFAVVRVLGDDMNVAKIMSLKSVLENMDFDDSDLGKFSDFFQ